MTNSRRKGKEGELDLVHFLAPWYKVRRGQQYSGANGDADVIGVPGLHIECKRVEKLNLDTALAQAMADAKYNEVPAVFHRKNRTEWKVTVRASDFMDLWKALECLLKEGGNE